MPLWGDEKQKLLRLFSRRGHGCFPASASWFRRSQAIKALLSDVAPCQIIDRREMTPHFSPFNVANGGFARVESSPTLFLSGIAERITEPWPTLMAHQIPSSYFVLAKTAVTGAESVGERSTITELLHVTPAKIT